MPAQGLSRRNPPAANHHSGLRRWAPFLVTTAFALSWAAALTQGWLGGSADAPFRPPPGAYVVDPNKRFDPRDVPITVDVYEFGFTPQNVVILAGHAVSWKDVGKELHTITPSTPAGRVVFLAARRQGSASHVFRKPGVYPYYCAIHPDMRGTVTVRRNLDGE